MALLLSILHNFRRNGRRKHGSDPPNWHFCTAGRSAAAASAAVGSAKSAAAFLGMPSQRMYGRNPPKMQVNRQVAKNAKINAERY
ncbi:MAG: hypothetical protein ABI970_01925 [Chloroflexota bacterium]